MKKSLVEREALLIAKGLRETESESQRLAAWQYLVDTNLAWRPGLGLEDTALDLILEGKVHLPRNKQTPEAKPDFEQKAGLHLMDMKIAADEDAA